MVKKFKRFPVHIGHDTVILVNVLSGLSKIEDMWLVHDEAVMDFEWNNFYEKAAKQLLDQLEDHYCDAFLMGLIKVCYDQLKESDQTYRSDSEYKTAEEVLKLLK